MMSHSLSQQNGSIAHTQAVVAGSLLAGVVAGVHGSVTPQGLWGVLPQTPAGEQVSVVQRLPSTQSSGRLRVSQAPDAGMHFVVRHPESLPVAHVTGAFATHSPPVHVHVPLHWLASGSHRSQSVSVAHARSAEGRVLQSQLSEHEDWAFWTQAADQADVQHSGMVAQTQLSRLGGAFAVGVVAGTHGCCWPQPATGVWEQAPLWPHTSAVHGSLSSQRAWSALRSHVPDSGRQAVF